MRLSKELSIDFRQRALCDAGAAFFADVGAPGRVVLFLLKLALTTGKASHSEEDQAATVEFVGHLDAPFGFLALFEQWCLSLLFMSLGRIERQVNEVRWQPLSRFDDLKAHFQL